MRRNLADDAEGRRWMSARSGMRRSGSGEAEGGPRARVRRGRCTARPFACSDEQWGSWVAGAEARFRRARLRLEEQGAAAGVRRSGA